MQQRDPPCVRMLLHGCRYSSALGEGTFSAGCRVDFSTNILWSKRTHCGTLQELNNDKVGMSDRSRGHLILSEKLTPSMLIPRRTLCGRSDFRPIAIRPGPWSRTARTGRTRSWTTAGPTSRSQPDSLQCLSGACAGNVPQILAASMRIHRVGSAHRPCDVLPPLALSPLLLSRAFPPEVSNHAQALDKAPQIYTNPFFYGKNSNGASGFWSYFASTLLLPGSSALVQQQPFIVMYVCPVTTQLGRNTLCEYPPGPNCSLPWHP
jgi:hypothetical protein